MRALREREERVSDGTASTRFVYKNANLPGFRRSAMDTVTRADKKSKKHNGVDATAEAGVDEAKVSCGLFWRLCF
jgi:hypothetical protein